MSEPTVEEKRKTIRLAKQLFQNMFAEVAADLQEYGETSKEARLLALAKIVKGDE